MFILIQTHLVWCVSPFLKFCCTPRNTMLFLFNSSFIIFFVCIVNKFGCSLRQGNRAKIGLVFFILFLPFVFTAIRIGRLCQHQNLCLWIHSLLCSYASILSITMHVFAPFKILMLSLLTPIVFVSFQTQCNYFAGRHVFCITTHAQKACLSKFRPGQAGWIVYMAVFLSRLSEIPATMTGILLRRDGSKIIPTLKRIYITDVISETVPSRQDSII